MSIIHGPAPAQGVVYTRPEVVHLMLELVGYTAEHNLVDMVAVEPAAGAGAFVLPMVQHLIASCQRQGRPLVDTFNSLRAYERDSRTAATTRQAIVDLLTDAGTTDEEAQDLAAAWMCTGNYLFLRSNYLDVLTTDPAQPDRLPLQVNLVIGNPPYVRLEDIPPHENRIYRQAYATMKGRADLYVAFFEAALSHLAPHGTCAFICSDRWMRNQYGVELRRLITTGYNLTTLIDMNTTNAFEDAVSAYPAITVIRREAQRDVVVGRITAPIDMLKPSALRTRLSSLRHAPQHTLTFAGGTACRTDSWFQGAAPWPYTSNERLTLLRHLEESYQPIDSWPETRIGIGVATGADAIYICHDVDSVEPDRLLPLARTSDVREGRLEWGGAYLINPWNADGLVDLTEYPRLQAYLSQHEAVLRGRHTAQQTVHGWYRTIDRVDHTLLRRPKLYIPDIKGTITPVLDRGETYPHHNLYYITSTTWDLEVLGALLMSDLGRFFVECYGVRIRGGYLRMQAQYLRRVCLPNPAHIPSASQSALVAAFRMQDRTQATAIACTLVGIDHLPSEG